MSVAQQKSHWTVNQSDEQVRSGKKLIRGRSPTVRQIAQAVRGISRARDVYWAVAWAHQLLVLSDKY